MIDHIRAAQLMAIERQCVIRAKECDRNCGECELVQDDTELIEAFSLAHDALIGLSRMKQNIRIEIGQTLPRSTWLNARDDLEAVFLFFGDYLRNINYEGKGEQDREEFLAEAQLAIQALTYVGMFAADKCRIVVLPDKQLQ